MTVTRLTHDASWASVYTMLLGSCLCLSELGFLITLSRKRVSKTVFASGSQSLVHTWNPHGNPYSRSHTVGQPWCIPYIMLTFGNPLFRRGTILSGFVKLKSKTRTSQTASTLSALSFPSPPSSLEKRGGCTMAFEWKPYQKFIDGMRKFHNRSR